MKNYFLLCCMLSSFLTIKSSDFKEQLMRMYELDLKKFITGVYEEHGFKVSEFSIMQELNYIDCIRSSLKEGCAINASNDKNVTKLIRASCC